MNCDIKCHLRTQLQNTKQPNKEKKKLSMHPKKKLMKKIIHKKKGTYLVKVIFNAFVTTAGVDLMIFMR